jgi:hypothetical protein
VCLLEARHDERVPLGLVGGIALIVLLFLPLIVHELQTSFQETRLIVDYLTGGDAGTGAGAVSALAFTVLRVVGWPLMGLVTDVPSLAALLLAATVGIVAIGLVRARGLEATGLRWLLAILAWSVVALAFAAPSLQRVVAGLPNDHYHAFLDPIVLILIAVPTARLFEGALAAWRAGRRPIGGIGAVVVAAGLAAFVAVALIRKPPLVDPDGGWPAMRDAGQRVATYAAGRPVTLLGLPDFKLSDAIGFPIEHAGGEVVGSADLMGFPEGWDVIVVACDRLFESVIGAPCGGPAEDAYVARLAGAGSGPGGVPPRLEQRFDASPRTSISIYAPVTP